MIKGLNASRVAVSSPIYHEFDAGIKLELFVSYRKGDYDNHGKADKI